MLVTPGIAVISIANVGSKQHARDGRYAVYPGMTMYLNAETTHATQQGG